VVQSRRNLTVVVVAALTLDLGGTKSHGHSSYSNVVLARCVSNDGRLAVMPNLGGDLAGGADAGVSTASGGAAGTSDNLEVGSHLGGSLLGSQAGVLVLRPIAPYGRLLFPQQGDIP